VRLAALAGAISVAAAAAPAPAQTSVEQAQLAAVHDRGALLYLIDRAAWVATDDFRSKIDIGADKTLRGYVVERAAQGFTVTFFGEEEGRLVRAFVAKVDRNKVIRSETFLPGKRVPLSAEQIRLAGARKLPEGLDFRSCTGPFNVTPIPPASGAEPMNVYFLSPQVRNKEYPFGGHFRVTLAPDGKILSSRKFTNACLNMPAPPPDAFAMGIAHILDPIPTEIHVFTALSAQKPVLVMTGSRTWQVDGSKIKLLDPSKIKSQPRR
jgi:hypothetical protein